ncbi:hypothetical protein I4U23_020838 [Adineta vaga]|nr:hypothetical protein I4U23_020838 [Adineta vaga]
MLQTMINTHSELFLSADQYCQTCSITSSINGKKRLSSFTCDHCHVSMCYDCFEKHTSQLIEEYSDVQKRFLQLSNLFSNKRELLATFEQHCIRNINSAFDEVFTDLQNLRNESIDYVKQQFLDAEITITNIITNIKPLTTKSRHIRTYDNVKTNILFEFEKQRQQINELEDRLNIFSSPNMKLKMFTYPRNRLDLHCQLLLNSSSTSKDFSSSIPGKLITAQCSYSQSNENESEKIVVDTEIEELNQNIYSTKQIQTDSLIELNSNVDDDEYYSVLDETSELSNRLSSEQYSSTHYISQGTIKTQNEVDRIASDGEHVLYFCDTLKLLCYVRDISYDKKIKEITCRWPHYPILDLIYSPGSSQFVCATRRGLYTCTIDSNNDSSTIDIQMQLTQHWSYVRLSADRNFLWLWTDTPRLSQLHVYSPKTFHCIKVFNLSDYSRFSDNSTSFCIHENLIGTVFQFKQIINSSTYKKHFHLTLCDTSDLRELCTIHLGECDIDHEIRANNEGKFFLTNGRKKLWIIDRHGRKEFVQLSHTGRALTVHGTHQILIANGTHQLQCIELIQNDL